jgi:hypothetical protein
VSEYSKLEEDLKSKLTKLKTEFKMPSALLELLFNKVSLLVEDAPYYMLPKFLIHSKQEILSKIWESKSLKEQFLFHVRLLLIMLDFKELQLSKESTQATISNLDLMQAKDNTLI